MIVHDTYTPESFKILNRTMSRALKYLKDSNGRPQEAFDAALMTLETITPEELVLPLGLHGSLVTLIGYLRESRWKNDPKGGADAISHFYIEMNQEMRRLGLKS
jgi:hypothetical protein